MGKHSSMIRYLRSIMIGGGLFIYSGQAISTSFTLSTSIPIPAASSTQPSMSKVDALVKAAELERQAAAKQATDVNAANLLREEARQLREHANNMKDATDKAK